MFNDIYIKTKPTSLSITGFEREAILPKLEEKQVESKKEIISKVVNQSLTAPFKQINNICQNKSLKTYKNGKPQFKTKLYNISDIKKKEAIKKNASDEMHKNEKDHLIIPDERLVCFSLLNATKEEIEQFFRNFSNVIDQNFLRFASLLDPLYRMANINFHTQLTIVEKKDDMNRNGAVKAIKNCIDILIQQEKYQPANLLLQKCVQFNNERFQIFIIKIYNILILKSPDTAYEFESYCDITSNEIIKNYIQKTLFNSNNHEFSLTNNNGILMLNIF